MVIERALDLACGKGRHSLWLAELAWKVTAVDLVPVSIPGVEFIQADLEKHEFTIVPESWDAIVCWLYWQADLMPEIAAGVREGGMVALAGKRFGRFATSVDNYRQAFRGWEEIDAGEDDVSAWFMARKPVPR